MFRERQSQTASAKLAAYVYQNTTTTTRWRKPHSHVWLRLASPPSFPLLIYSQHWHCLAIDELLHGLLPSIQHLSLEDLGASVISKSLADFNLSKSEIWLTPQLHASLQFMFQPQSRGNSDLVQPFCAIRTHVWILYLTLLTLPQDLCRRRPQLLWEWSLHQSVHVVRKSETMDEAPKRVSGQLFPYEYPRTRTYSVCWK